jgi:hypothetical protein
LAIGEAIYIKTGRVIGNAVPVIGKSIVPQVGSLEVLESVT